MKHPQRRVLSPDRPRVPDVLPRFLAYNRKHFSWGALHVVLADGNLRDCFVEGTAAEAEARGDVEGAALARLLEAMSPSQRGRIAQRCSRVLVDEWRRR